MTPPFAVPAVTVDPGARLTFSGTASDDEGLGRTSRSPCGTPRPGGAGQRLHLGLSTQAGNCRVSPVDLEWFDLQLDLHDAVQPVPGQLLVHRAGHRRPRADDVVDQPGPSDHQRPVCR